MNGKIADSTALGYIGIFISTWMLGMVDAGWFSSVPHWGFYTVLIVGGIGVSIAGILSFLNNDKVQGTLFIFLGVMFFSYSLANLSVSAGGEGSAGYSAWIDLVIAVIFFIIWMGGKNSGTWKSLYIIGAAVLFVLYAISDGFMLGTLHIIAGYVNLILALIAAFIAFNDLSGSGQPASAA